ncbi:hypothetical protein [Paraburkholderia solisilvae]|uniref:Uncharacterized protein n=1 Tax=Paraburkholderia solisilvae TaxID=624376 RepID=A0A6J5E0L8_9BURK|nr:hypothetical protein [Paraburkholderia solisilvae]CAB3759021.1 hypothetical protein LMG29739_03055 [Paraburkholderia solisilvae]
MKPVTTAAVATAAVASQLSYAQPAIPLNPLVVMASQLNYAQSQNKPEMHSAMASGLNDSQSAGPQSAPFVSLSMSKERDEMISRPKTATEFVLNLKVIFDQDLLLNDDFYNEENLKNVFNLDDVDVDRARNQNGEHQISLITSRFHSIFPREYIPGVTNPVAGAQMVAGKTIHRSGLVTAAVNFGTLHGGPDFDETTRIFGRDFVYLPPMPNPHRVTPPATAPHGNEHWRYQEVSEGTERTITILFDPAGNLSDILIEISRK